MIVDDHDIVRMGLASLLNDSEFEVVAEAEGEIEAVQKALDIKPDIILMDVRLQDGSGINACKQIISQNANIRVLMLSSYADDEAVMESIEAGASGYILKEISRQALREAIKKVVEGEVLLDAKITVSVFNRVRQQSNPIVASKKSLLTEKEKLILVEVAKGKGNREIAKELFLSEYTVRNYVSSILNKLNFTSRVQLANYAYEHGLKN